MSAQSLPVLRYGNLVITPALTDRLLAEAYIRFEEEGQLQTIFHQGVPSIKEFIDDHLKPFHRIGLGCFREHGPEEKPEFCGIGWAFHAEKMGNFLRAECGMGFFKRQSVKTENLLFGKLLLRYFFDHHQIDVIHGLTPESNRLALRYSQKLGFSLHGPIPDACVWKEELCPAWISHLSKSQFLERGY